MSNSDIITSYGIALVKRSLQINNINNYEILFIKKDYLMHILHSLKGFIIEIMIMIFLDY